MLDVAKLKLELQGGKGLIGKIRDEHIPNSRGMSELAQQEFERRGLGFDDVDAALEELLSIEYAIYQQKHEAFGSSFLKEAASLVADGAYPEVCSLIEDYRRRVASGEDPVYALDGVARLFSIIAQSSSQSGRTRSGSSLMNHIAYLLARHGFIEGTDFKRELVLGNGCKLDFFFPNEARFKHEPKDCCAVACQTTSNDRFRLTFAQMPASTRNRACTAIGSKNFSEKLGPASLTDEKLAETRSKEVKYVVLANAIDDRLRNSRAVMSYKEWFQELKGIKPLWSTA